MAGLHKETKHKLIKGGIAILVIATFFISMWIICKSLGLTSIDGIKTLVLRGGAWSAVLYIGLYIILCIILCFVPGTSMLMIGAGVALFGANWKTFLMCFAGVVISSLIMDVLGRFGGSKIICFIVGQKSYDEAINLLSSKGAIYVPIMYLLPLFPDDAICMCCGMIKVKWWVHLIEIVLCRGIGCATIIFGVKLIPYEEFNSLYDWFVCIACVIVYVTLMLTGARKIDKWLSNRKNTH